MTNDGELAAKLTQASSHVPKTYLVKISGQAKKKKSKNCAMVLTSAASRAAGNAGNRRAGKVNICAKSENPWYEVTLIEGREPADTAYV